MKEPFKKIFREGIANEIILYSVWGPVVKGDIAKDRILLAIDYFREWVEECVRGPDDVRVEVTRIEVECADKPDRWPSGDCVELKYLVYGIDLPLKT